MSVGIELLVQVATNILLAAALGLSAGVVFLACVAIGLRYYGRSKVQR